MPVPTYLGTYLKNVTDCKRPIQVTPYMACCDTYIHEVKAVIFTLLREEQLGRSYGDTYAGVNRIRPLM